MSAISLQMALPAFSLGTKPVPLWCVIYLALHTFVRAQCHYWLLLPNAQEPAADAVASTTVASPASVPFIGVRERCHLICLIPITFTMRAGTNIKDNVINVAPAGFLPSTPAPLPNHLLAAAAVVSWAMPAPASTTPAPVAEALGVLEPHRALPLSVPRPLLSSLKVFFLATLTIIIC